MKKIIYFLVTAFILSPMISSHGLSRPNNLITYAQEETEEFDGPTPGINDDDLSLPPTTEFKNTTDLVSELGNIGGLVDYYENSKIKPLRLSGTDKLAIEDGVVDKRVIASLIKLTTPVDQGGYGHKLKVNRIIKNYKGKKNLSKESDYSDSSGEEKVTPNISAHNEQQAQAYDIQEIDEYQCTVKKPGGKTKKLPPQPIRVTWQDKAPGKNIGDQFSSPRIFGSDFAAIGNQIFSDQLLIGLSDNLDSYLEGFDLKGSSLTDVVKSLGKARWQEEFGSLAFPNETNLEKLAKSIGTAYLSKELNIDLQTISGKNNELLIRNIALGRLGNELGIEGIKGNTVDDWLEPIFQSKVETLLDLDKGVLAQMGSGISARKLAMAKFSATTRIPVSLLNKSISEIEKVYQVPINQIISSPITLDIQLGLPAGSTQSYLQNRLSADDYYKQIEQDIKTSFRPEYASPDKTFDLPEGTIKSFTDTSSFSNTVARKAGAYLLGKAIKSDDQQLKDLLDTVGKGGKIGKLDASRADISLSPEETTAFFNSGYPGRDNLIRESGLSAINQLANSKAKDLYVGFKPQKIKDIINGKLSAEDYAINLGKNYLETYFDLDSGALDTLSSGLKTTIFNQDGKTSDTERILGQIATSMNLDLDLEHYYRNAPAGYKITPQDVSLLLKGNQTAITDKIGGMLMDTAIQGLKGNGYDLIKGQISPERFMANAALAAITKTVLKTDPEKFGTPGIASGQDKRIGNIANYIEKEFKTQAEKFTVDRILSSLGVDEDLMTQYSFNNVAGTIELLKDPKKNADALKDNLVSIMSETVAAKAGLPSGSITGFIKDPNLAKNALAEYGISYLETNLLGVEKGTLLSVYKDQKISLPQILSIKKISDITGITNPEHVNWILNGNIEQGLKAAGIAFFTKEVNEGLSNPAARIAYDTISKAYFGSKIDEDKMLETIKKNTPGIAGGTLSDLDKNQGVRLARMDLRKQANYSLLDAQLIKKDSSIPVGFTKKMFEGTDKDRIDSLKDYAAGKITITDSELSEKIGIPVPEGTAAILKDYATGKVNFDAVKSKLETGGKNLAISYGFAFGDKALGFAPGTTQALYSSYKQYQSLRTGFEAGKMSAKEFQGSQIALAVTAVDLVTGGAITKATTPIDNALGLPPGATLQIAMAIVTGNYIQAAFIVASAILGWGKVKCPDLQKLAQEKVRLLLTETMQIAKDTKDSDLPLVPSQILTWRDEDITATREASGTLYGPSGTLEKAGIFKTLNPREIHIGF